MDTNSLLATGLAATATLWVVTWVRQPGTRLLAVRGVVAALGVALVLAIAVGLATLLLGYKPADGLLAGAVIGGGFLWLNLVVLAIGLWFRPTSGWAVGACLATPVILAAIGFGYAAYLAWPL